VNTTGAPYKCSTIADCGCTENNTLYGGSDMCWRTVLMSGLRQGGRAYFALDVTDADTVTAAVSSGAAPRILPLWEFQDNRTVSGTLVPNRLGDSWSTPFLAELLKDDTGGVKVTDVVALFGGGETAGEEPNVGPYFYILNLETGKLFTNTAKTQVISRFLVPDNIDPNWKTKVEAGATVETTGFKNNNKVPSDPSVVDMDGDGITDIVYFGDLQGRVWKMNVHSKDWAQRKLCLFYDTGDLTGETRANPVPGCGTSGSDTDLDCRAEQRPVFYSPTVITMDVNGGETVGIPSDVTKGNLVIFGTGHIEDTANALDQTTVNRIFAVLDVDPLEGATVCSYGVLWNNTLANNGGCPSCPHAIEYPYDLQPGEKIISKPYVVNGVLIFQTYSPITSNVCDPGEVRFWEVEPSTFYGFLNLGAAGGKYLTLENFTTSGYAITNKWGIIVFSPPGGFPTVGEISGMRATIMSWAEGISF
jgi:Tfp pilus tip-associated adhesin PilY1